MDNDVTDVTGFPTRNAMRCSGLHFAYARELAADLFVSFDNDQLALAKASGLKVANPAS